MVRRWLWLFHKKCNSMTADLDIEASLPGMNSVKVSGAAVILRNTSKWHWYLYFMASTWVLSYSDWLSVAWKWDIYFPAGHTLIDAAVMPSNTEQLPDLLMTGCMSWEPLTHDIARLLAVIPSISYDHRQWSNCCKTYHLAEWAWGSNHGCVSFWAAYQH
jgi:hypothetical protein